MTKKLHRSSKHKVLGGVCGGIADYFGIDPIITRLAFVLITFASHVFGGILVYIIAWIIIPLDTADVVSVKTPETKKEESSEHADSNV